MALKPGSRRPIGKQAVTPPRLDTARRAGSSPGPSPGASDKAPPPRLPTLAEQKADFTAEGAPAPGKVVASTAPRMPARAP